MKLDTYTVVKYATNVIAICSIIHNTLPPVSDFDDFPKTQKVYKLIVAILQSIALNGRDKNQDRLPGTTTTETAVTTTATVKGATTDVSKR